MRHRLLSILIPVLLLLCGCSSNKVTFFDDVNGEQFPYECPITAVTDAGDSLILGTSRGDIVSYNLSDGSYRHVYHDAKGRFVYNILKCEDGSLIYSVQNGGVNHVTADGEVTVYEIIPEKGSNYSAYRFIYDDDNIFAATSNGVYQWSRHAPDPEYKRLDLVIQDNPNDIISSRFYSIEPDPSDPGAYICSGERGRYSLDTTGRVSCLSTEPICSAHGDLVLTKDGKLMKNGKLLSELSINALDFVSDGVHIYALSLSAIEIIDAVSGEYIVTINMPDERGTDKNVSCRSFCMIKGDYLYVVPSGCALYRLPLYRHWTQSKEVVQICQAGESSAYVITRDNDLYRFDADESGVSYRRSFEKSSDVKLIGAYEDVLVVTIDGRYHELSGIRLTDQEPLDELNTMSKAKVLWHLMDGPYLYQGQVDMIRRYDGRNGWSLSEEYHKDDSIDRDPTREEYYPERACIYEDEIFVYTMHYGTFQLTPKGFVRMERLKDLVMKDIEATKSAIYALTDDQVLIDNNRVDSISVRFTNAAFRHFNDIIPLNDDSFIAYTTYNNRSIRGIALFERGVDNTWTVSHHLSTSHIHDGAVIGDCAVVAGSMGLCVVVQDGVMEMIQVTEPTFFQKNVIAWNYPWGVVIYVMVLLAGLSLILWCMMVFRRYYLKYRYAKIYDDFYRWVKSEYEGKYVRALAKQIKKVSADKRKLAVNIAMFKSMSAELHHLENFMNEVLDLYEKVKSMKAMDIEHENRERIRALKDSLEVLCKPEHPFGNAIIKAWGKSTVQPIRTMMLLPLRFKIKFMQIFDSRTGTEKMDFKAFMDRDKASILDRDLQIRDLIALAAYDAIVSEKGSADA